MATIPGGVGSLQITDDDVIGHSINMFSSAPREVAMLSGDEVAYRPDNESKGGPYTFTINPQGNRGLLLNTARLELKVKIVKADGSAMGAADLVAPVNNFAGAFTDKVDILLDGSEISALSNTYHSYKHYIETLLSYGFSAEYSHLQAAGWYLDVPTRYNETAIADATANKGFLKRRSLVANSQVYTTIAPLSSDIMQVDTMFPMGYPLCIRITKARDNFLIIKNPESHTEYKVEVVSMRLFIRHLSLTEQATAGTLNTLASEPVVIPYNKTEIKEFLFGKDERERYFSDIVRGSIPKSVIIFMNTQEDATSMGKNPFNFGHQNVEEAYIRVNGNQIPGEPYRPIWSTSTGAAREHRAFNDNVGVQHSRSGNLVSMDQFRGGAFFLAFDLSPDRCNGYHHHLPKTGTIDLYLKLSTEATEVLKVYVFSTYNAELRISPGKETQVVY